MTSKRAFTILRFGRQSFTKTKEWLQCLIRERILLASLRLFASRGYEAVPVSTIAGALGMTKSALYKHYKSKRDIFDSIVARMEQLDGERGKSFELPEGVSKDMGEALAAVSGRFAFDAASPSDYPAVGDYAVIDTEGGVSLIQRVLPRKSVFLRRAAGTGMTEQVIAANIDTVFVCMSLNEDFNARRLERYASAVWDGGAVPVVVLTKTVCAGTMRISCFRLKPLCRG